MRIFKAKIAVLSLVLIGSATAFANTDKAATVTVPMTDFLRLRESNEKPSLTVVEEVSITGNFEKDLTLTVVGSSTGKASSVEVLKRTDAYNLRGCAGSALLHSSGDNLAVLPQASRFKLSCKVEVRSWTQVQFAILNSLFVRAAVLGSESIVDESGGDERNLTLTRARTTDPEYEARVEIATVGRHKITILPEESRFEYQLVFSNPGRNKRTLVFPLVNGEIVQTLRTSIESKELDQRIELTLVPGENRVTVLGRYTAQEFKAPIVNAQNFLLIESHPMLQTSVSGPKRRISAQDTGLSSTYSATRAYLLSQDDSAEWKAKKLEVFSSLGYSIASADFLFYVPRSGKSLVEATLEIDNQGTPEIPLEIPGRVTYLEIAGEPQVLSKDDQGRLLLQLATGRQHVILQYETDEKVSGLMASAQQTFARPATILSNVNARLALDEKWQLAFGHGVNEIRSDWKATDVIYSFVALVFSLMLLGSIVTSTSVRILGAMAIAFLVFFMPEIKMLLILAVIVGAAIRYREDLKNRKPKTWQGWAGAALASAVGLTVLSSMNVTQQLTNVSRPEMATSYQQGFNVASNTFANARNKLSAFGGGGVGLTMDKGSPNESQADVRDGRGSQNDFQGLPAKITIPQDVRLFRFSQGMIDSSGQVEMEALLVSRGSLGFVVLMCFMTLGLILFRDRKNAMKFFRLEMRRASFAQSQVA